MNEDYIHGARYVPRYIREDSAICVAATAHSVIWIPPCSRKRQELANIVSTGWSYTDKKHDFKLNGNWTSPTSALNLHLDAEQNHLRPKAFVMNMTNEDVPMRTRFAVDGAAVADNVVAQNDKHPDGVFQQFIADFVPRKPRQLGFKAIYSALARARLLAVPRRQDVVVVSAMLYFSLRIPQ